MPNRDDFEMEYENDAEILVSSIDAGAGVKVDPEDEQLESSLKLAHVEMYQNKLKERERRKQASKDLTLVDNFFKENPYNAMTGKLTAQKLKKKDSKQEFLDKLKFVSSFQGIEDYKKVMAGINKERDLKYRIKGRVVQTDYFIACDWFIASNPVILLVDSKVWISLIKELHRYRKNGINALKEAESYEAERVKRNKKKADRKKALEAGLPEPPSVEPSPVKEDSKTMDLDTLNSILGLPGYQILSTNEKRLCTSLRLHPSLYISYKTCLLRDHLQKKKGQSPKPVRIYFNFIEKYNNKEQMWEFRLLVFPILVEHYPPLYIVSQFQLFRH